MSDESIEGGYTRGSRMTEGAEDVVGGGEVTDGAWAELKPLLPENGGRGQQRRDHRQVVNGILWKLRTGAPWRDLPERYGPWRTA